MVESLVLLAILCQFLCIITVSSLAVSGKGVIMGTLLVSFCGLCRDDR